jgi:hypothetical protein
MKQFDHYKKEKLTINLLWVNLLGVFLTIPIILIFGLPYYLIWSEDFTLSSLEKLVENTSTGFVICRVLIFFALVILGVIIHELLHGIIWSRYAEKGFKSIKFGISWKMLTPYCHCTEPLKVRYYVFGAVMPAIILGFVPSIISLLIGNLAMLLFGMIFTFAAIGDFLIVFLLRKENMDNMVEDHPSEAGCFIYRKIK